MTKNIKLYFVQFKDKSNGDIFYKFGHTSNYDVLHRFNDEHYYGDMYKKWHIKVMCSAYGPVHLVEQAEEHLKKTYPKNFSLREKIKGVTEIVKLKDSKQIGDIIAYIKQLSREWHHVRHADTEITNCASSLYTKS